MGDSTRIVVGVDGSPGSKKALRWALDYAKVVPGARVEAVMSWQYPVLPAGPMGVDMMPALDLAGPTDEQLRDALAEVHRPDDVDVTPVVVCSSPANALLDVATDADLVVVGTRGLGGFKQLMLGSVSQQVVHHAPCPVVVVPDPEAHAEH
jgi:nucleotide-binding universal stress UspA family protein